MRLIPGVRQDAFRRLYQVKVDDKGGQELVFVEAPPLTPRAQRDLEPVTVESTAYKMVSADSLEGKTPEQQAKLQAILDRGPTYQSLMCLQRTSA